MGMKRRPAFILANREHFTLLSYSQIKAYRDKALVPLNKKADKLLKELIFHLTRMRVKHTVQGGNEIRIFADADDFQLRRMGVSFVPMFFNYPEVPNGRMRLTFLKTQESQSPTWFRIRKVSVSEPVYGFDTLALAKNLRELRRQYMAKRRIKRAQQKNVNSSRSLADSFVIPEHLSERFNISTSPSYSDPERFELEITHTVNVQEAREILRTL